MNKTLGELDADEQLLWQRIEKLETSKDFWKYVALSLLALVLFLGLMRVAPPSHGRQSPFIAEPE